MYFTNIFLMKYIFIKFVFYTIIYIYFRETSEKKRKYPIVKKQVKLNEKKGYKVKREIQSSENEEDQKRARKERRQRDERDEEIDNHRHGDHSIN